MLSPSTSPQREIRDKVEIKLEQPDIYPDQRHKELSIRLCDLKTHIDLFRVHTSAQLKMSSMEIQELSIQELQNEYQALSLLLQNKIDFTQDQLLTIAEYQTFILEAIVFHLDPLHNGGKNGVEDKPTSPWYKRIVPWVKQLFHPENKEETNEKAKGLKKTPWWKKIVFIFLMGVDMLPMAIQGMLSAEKTLVFLPFAIANPILLIVGVILNALEVLLYYSFMAPLLKKNLGFEKDQTNSQYRWYLRQKKLTKTLNQILNSNDNQKVHALTANQFDQFTDFAVVCNKDFISKKENFTVYKENKLVTATRYVVSVVNALQSLGGIYFIANSLLLVAGFGALVGSPIGWVMVASLMFLSIATRFLYRSNGMFVTLNTKTQETQEVKDKLDKFKPKDKNSFENALRTKQELEHSRKQKGVGKTDEAKNRKGEIIFAPRPSRPLAIAIKALEKKSSKHDLSVSLRSSRAHGLFSHDHGLKSPSTGSVETSPLLGTRLPSLIAKRSNPGFNVP